MGNPPGQGIHDCATLENKIKCMSSGFEFITPDLKQVVVWCTGMRPIAGGEDATGVAMLETPFRDVFGRPYKEE
jgi:hypothetical protein